MLERLATERVKTGMDELDSHLDGGFPRKTAILLSGGPGAGKTLFGLNFLITGATAGERCCYISLSESREDLLRACEYIENLAVAKDYLGENLIIVSPDLTTPRAFQNFIEVFEKYPPMERLVIDNLNKLLICSDNGEHHWLRLSGLLKSLREKVGCSLLLHEAMDMKNGTGILEASECDGVLELSFMKQGEKMIRVLSVRKLRYTGIEPGIVRELLIDGKGLRCSDYGRLKGAVDQK